MDPDRQPPSYETALTQPPFNPNVAAYAGGAAPWLDSGPPASSPKSSAPWLEDGRPAAAGAEPPAAVPGPPTAVPGPPTAVPGPPAPIAGQPLPYYDAKPHAAYAPPPPPPQQPQYPTAQYGGAVPVGYPVAHPAGQPPAYGLNPPGAAGYGPTNAMPTYYPTAAPVNIHRIQPVAVPVAVSFGRHPMTMMCPHCSTTISTATEREPGARAYCACLFLAAVGAFVCCFVPFCLDPCYDVTHKCPQCQAKLGKSSF